MQQISGRTCAYPINKLKPFVLTMTKIKTNNQPRDLMYFSDLTEVEQQQTREEFDWMSVEDLECNFGFFKYKGQIEHLQSFSRTDSFESWDGCMPLTAFSGWLIKLTPNCNQVICGQYFC